LAGVLQEARERPEAVTVLFEDEASFYRQPSQGWLWSWMGRRQPRMRYSHRANTVMRVVGFLDAADGRVHAWHFGKVSASRFARCLLEVASQYPQAQRIYVVVDNWPVHFHPLVLAALAREPRLELVRLPTYAPWLNASEKVWRWVRQRVSHAHPWCDDFAAFTEAVMSELRSFSQGSPALLRYVGLLAQ
jgi:hypothetical protein